MNNVGMSAEMRQQAKAANDAVERIIAEAKEKPLTPEQHKAAYNAVLAEYAKLAVQWGYKSRKVKKLAEGGSP